MLLSLTAHLQSPYLLPRGPTSCRFYHLFIEPEPGDQAFNKNTSHSDISIIVLVAFLVCRNDSAGKDTAKLGDQFTLWCERTNFLKKKKKKLSFFLFALLIKGQTYFALSWKPQSTTAGKAGWQECVRQLVPWHLWSGSKRRMLLLSSRSLYIHLCTLSREMGLPLLRARLSMLVNPI